MISSDKVTVPGRYSEIERLCQFIAEGATKANFDDDTLFKIQLACDEACTNVIEHAYGAENQGEIVVQWHITPTDFIITIADQGQPFDPQIVPLPDRGLPIEELKVGGLGLHFMRKLMDTVAFSFNDTGNLLTMVKHRPVPAG